jgi:hypothetical protein
MLTRQFIRPLENSPALPQSSETRRLARQLLRNHRSTKSWHETARRLNITNKDGNPSPGLAYQIAVDKYEPRREETRVRLGLSPEIKLPRPRRTINDHLAEDTIQDMPAPLLAWALENRTEMSA